MNEDEKAKEMARRQPGTEMIPRENSREAASRLDKRIAASRNAPGRTTSNNSKEEARASRAAAVSASYREPASRRSRELSRMEADAAAKSSARSSIGGVYQPPGPIRLAAKARSGDLERKQAARIAKEQAKAAASGSEIRSEIAELEAAVTGKPLRATSTSSTTVSVASGAPVFGVRSDIEELTATTTGKPLRATSSSSVSRDGRTRRNLTQLEADVSAKSKYRDSQGVSVARTNRSPTSATSPDFGTSRLRAPGPRPGISYCTNLDERIAQKTGVFLNENEANASSPKPGSDNCSDLDERIAQKTGLSTTKNAEDSPQSTSKSVKRPFPIERKTSFPLDEKKTDSQSKVRPGITHCANLDERIAYKTGIPLDSKAADEQENPAIEDEDKVVSVEKALSKLTGLSAATMNAALEKLKAGHDNCDIETLAGRRYLVDGSTICDEETADETRDRLAVATAVDEGEEDMFIPAAVEYDPDAKPPIYRNRRFRLYGLLACALLVIVIATTIGLLSQRDTQVIHDKDEPSPAPTSVRYKLGIQEQLELVVGFEKLNDPESPHYRALDWIVNEDPMQLSPDQPNLVQRFLLATFYFATHEEGDWLSCNAPVGEEDQFCFYKQLVGVFPNSYNDIPWVRWLSAPHECLWAGVYCDELDQIRAIDLVGQTITSKLPIELAYLPFMQGINLAWNNFYGEIPVEYGQMKYLLNLELHFCDLTGTIPSDWSHAKNLQLFNAGGNVLTGTIPSDMSNLAGLKGIFLFDNMLTGDFPSNMNLLESLTYFRVHLNSLSGTIPANIGDVAAIREFWVQRNSLKGTIPSELGRLVNVNDLRLQHQEIEGPIPTELWELSQLYRLDLYNMKLNGTLSPLVSQLSALGSLRVQVNELTGEIPTELGLMTNLQRLRLETNYFSGTVPAGICDMKGPEGLHSLIADCYNSTFNDGYVECECCDSCCSLGECFINSVEN